MAYGVHWEWRGFGTIDGVTEARILALPAAAVPERMVTDAYLWRPGLRDNVKLREWEGGGSLKVKRQLDPGPGDGTSLWIEEPDEDYGFPLSGAALERVLSVLELDTPGPPPAVPVRAADLLAWVAGATPVPRRVEVRKRRRSFVRHRGPVPVLVELAEIDRPERIRSLGIEDMAGLDSTAPAERTALARRCVSEAAAVLGAGLRVLTYPEAVGIWAGGGSVAPTGVGYPPP